MHRPFTAPQHYPLFLSLAEHQSWRDCSMNNYVHRPHTLPQKAPLLCLCVTVYLLVTCVTFLMYLQTDAVADDNEIELGSEEGSEEGGEEADGEGAASARAKARAKTKKDRARCGCCFFWRFSRTVLCLFCSF